MKIMMRRLLWLVTILGFSLPAFAANKILVVISSADQLQLKDGSMREVGFYLNELTVPLKKLIDAGYTPVYVTPGGALPHLDPASDDPKYFGGDRNLYSQYKSFLGDLHLLDKNLSPVRNIDDFKDNDFADYSAVFVPGGHAPMMDLVTNRSLGKILRTFHAQRKPTALICHGPVSLISALDNPEEYLEAVKAGDKFHAEQLAREWVYQGCEITVFSDVEDEAAEAKKFKGKMQFFPEDALRWAGGFMNEALPGKSNVTQCQELLTGQNPQSDVELADRLLEILTAQSSK